MSSILERISAVDVDVAKQFSGKFTFLYVAGFTFCIESKGKKERKASYSSVGSYVLLAG